MTDRRTKARRARLEASRRALAESFWVASLPPVAAALTALPKVGAPGWAPVWIGSLRLALEAAERWAATATKIEARAESTRDHEEAKALARCLTTVARQAGLLLGECERLSAEESPPSPRDERRTPF